MYKNIGISFLIVVLFGSLFLVGCQSNKDNNGEIKISLEGGVSKKNSKIANVDSLNEENTKIDGKKDLNPEEENMNKPSRDDLVFTKELEFGKADLAEIKGKGGLEIGRGNVYNFGVPEKFKTNFESVLDDYEKDRVFYMGDGNFSFFYFTESSYEEIGNKYKKVGFKFTKKTTIDNNIVLYFKKGALEGQIIYYSKLQGDGEVVGTALGIMKGSYVAIYRTPTEEEMKKMKESLKDQIGK